MISRRYMQKYLYRDMDNKQPAGESVTCCVHTKHDCIMLLKLAELGVIQRTKTRLTREEKSNIKPGTIYIYNEEESGIRRWTDRREWTPSRFQGVFLVYKELKGPLLKKTFSGDMSNRRWHLVIYSLIKWETSGACCYQYSRVAASLGLRQHAQFINKHYEMREGYPAAESMLNPGDYGPLGRLLPQPGGQEFAEQGDAKQELLSEIYTGRMQIGGPWAYGRNSGYFDSSPASSYGPRAPFEDESHHRQHIEYGYRMMTRAQPHYHYDTGPAGTGCPSPGAGQLGAIRGNGYFGDADRHHSEMRRVDGMPHGDYSSSRRMHDNMSTSLGMFINYDDNALDPLKADQGHNYHKICQEKMDPKQGSKYQNAHKFSRMFAFSDAERTTTQNAAADKRGQGEDISEITSEKPENPDGRHSD